MLHRVAAKRRFEIFSRTVAAVVGGYAFASLFVVAVSISSRDARADAVLTGMMTSFVVYVGAFLWCFSASSALRAWLGLLLCALPFAAAALSASRSVW
ncbi:DUF3649 domain-containing protein [Methylosinus sp. Sm6]|nr:DUF3649 domain-containing protein [Methylosinus sp. Sm6]